MSNLFPNREAWLLAFTAAARPAFEQVGAPIPDNVRMAIGFPSTGKKGKAIGECWASEASADGTFEIFVTPLIDDSSRVADILTHELVHAAVGLEAKHGKAFRKVATALGLEGKMTATVAGDAWHEWADPILAELGPIPHAAITPRSKSSGPKEQKGRNIKVECDDCGFTFRTTAKWIDAALVNGLVCPSADCGGHCSPDL